MHSIFKLILVLILTLSEAACVYRSHLTEGINCFKIQNYREAFIHLKPEADKGQPDAQYAVGYMYYYGRGVAEDRRKACIWIKSAAAKGQPDAIRALKIIKRKSNHKKRDPFKRMIYQHPYEY
ncbi:MAG: sel1 repeat family protein [Tatlockia sp.]|nr:sel1 repeat family protein [Tatlockia sp.]